MKTLIVVAHPELSNSNLQPFLKEASQNFKNVKWHVINSNYSIAEEQSLLRDADRIVFQFPLYWYQAPGLLLEWIDTVFSIEFSTGNQFNLQGKELGLVVSTGEAAKNFRAGGSDKFTLSELMRPFETFANKTKMHYLPIFAIHQFLYMSPDDQKRIFISYQEYLTNPDFNHFHGQENWFEEQLKKKISSDVENQSRLETILTTLQENQANLDDIQWNLSLLKREDDK